MMYGKEFHLADLTALQFRSYSLENIIVTLGKQGAVAISQPGTQVVQAHAYSVNAVDTTAAGDIFNAAFVYSYYINHLPAQKALQFANAVAACHELFCRSQPKDGGSRARTHTVYLDGKDVCISAMPGRRRCYSGNRGVTMHATEIATGVWRLPVSIANVYFVRAMGGRWVVIDTGLPGHAKHILQAAEKTFGAQSKPVAIILTHGHFDHAGSSLELAGYWQVPVFAHSLGRPFLTGASAYPPSDPTIGGALAFLSRFLPSKTANLGPHLQDLPEGQIPELPGWNWLHTPGHSPGNVSFFNQELSVLISGDAAATVDMDSWLAMITQARKISRPPAPFVTDWADAQRSVDLLARLAPFTIGSGHGTPMSGAEVAQELEQLARHFPFPEHGRYAVQAGRTDEHGIVSLPPAPPDRLPLNAALAAGSVTAGSALAYFALRPKARRACRMGARKAA
jgi:glyoxylase-like metal-dependent hydrolase (beta-lactamase superfamily II)